MIPEVLYPEYPVGTVFNATYLDIDTNLAKRGIFIVYYDEGTDPDTGFRNHNVLAFKLTTNPKAVTGHAFPLLANQHSFLTKDCYIMSTKTYLFHKKFVERVLGTLNTKTLTDFFYNSFVTSQMSIASQLINKIKIGGNK